MAGFLRWILILPVLLYIIYFANINPQHYDVTVYPGSDPLTLAPYTLVLMALAIGFLLGVITLWLSQGKLRKERRDYKKKTKKLEKEIQDIHDQMTDKFDTPDLIPSIEDNDP